MKESQSRQLFKNLSDCYADTWHSERGFMEEGEVIQAMTEDRFVEALKEAKPLLTPNVMSWISVKDAMPTKDGQYITYIKTKKYDSIGFTQYSDGEFMSTSVTHWMEIVKPCI